jgi:hypothetical protein
MLRDEIEESPSSESTDFSRRKTRQVLEKIGGASRDRTDDLIVANDALSQLSYSPGQVRTNAQPF